MLRSRINCRSSSVYYPVVLLFFPPCYSICKLIVAIFPAFSRSFIHSLTRTHSPFAQNQRFSTSCYRKSHRKSARAEEARRKQATDRPSVSLGEKGWKGGEALSFVIPLWKALQTYSMKASRQHGLSPLAAILFLLTLTNARAFDWTDSDESYASDVDVFYTDDPNEYLTALIRADEQEIHSPTMTGYKYMSGTGFSSSTV